jgi:hypothetical protein
MRRLIENLAPGDHISWRWVGGMFALYVVLMITVAGVLVSHEPSKKLARQAAQTAPADAKPHSIVRAPAHRVADND